MDNRFFWFPLHSGDFLSKTASLSAQEIGCFILLLVHLTRHKRLPGTFKELRRICKGANEKAVKAAVALLDSDEEGFYCEDLETFRKKSVSISIQKSIAGKKGALKRWGDNNL